jgi:HAD superfamily hydrolase (TIGR01484 family)
VPLFFALRFSSPLPSDSPSLSLIDWDLSQRASVCGVLTDIDDTLTTDGSITPDALAALQALHSAGLPVFAITGRPAGWSEPFALAWPVNAIVAENGAVALWRGADGQLHKAYLQDEATRRTNFERLQAVAQRVLTVLPQARLAQDSPGRETDIAIDHSEFAHLDEADIARVVALMREGGLSATVSSIHINGWIGDHDKLAGARWIVREQLGRDLDAEADRWVYVGDSTNDATMFGHFPHSVGVANVARFWGRLSHRPRYVTGGERGAGFAEVARAVLSARPAAPVAGGVL